MPRLEYPLADDLLEAEEEAEEDVWALVSHVLLLIDLQLALCSSSP